MTPLAKNIRRVSSADGGILLDIGRGTMFRLNPLGSRVLDLLDTEQSLPKIIGQISAEFDVARDVVQTDVQDFLNALQRHCILDSRGVRDLIPTER
jgi:Coenzyme PQQ synthesis protein D (PqqD)